MKNLDCMLYWKKSTPALPCKETEESRPCCEVGRVGIELRREGWEEESIARELGRDGCEEGREGWEAGRDGMEEESVDMEEGWVG